MLYVLNYGPTGFMASSHNGEFVVRSCEGQRLTQSAFDLNLIDCEESSSS